MAREQVGTVEITRVRIYQLDPYVRDPVATCVVVQPGTYPVYRDDDTRYWRMTGTINHQHERLGDGLFIMRDHDVVSDDDVVFYSRRYGPDEWAELLATFTASPALVFTITEAASA